jgi:hypothetical protein
VIHPEQTLPRITQMTPGWSCVTISTAPRPMSATATSATPQAQSVFDEITDTLNCD